jgi:succinate dehydrogenase/fumarate reductase flavoprotein subunit
MPTTPPTPTEFDVIVVGGGGSGLAAAISAAEAGARVGLLEKGPSLRGSTGRSIGSIAVSGTPQQRALGVVDSPEEHAEDYLKIAGRYADREDPELVRLLTENVTDTFSWLCGMGLEFFGPVADPGHRHPRLHNVLPTSQSYIHHLARRARRVGVRIMLDTAADELVHMAGRVTGLRTADGRTLLARRGVVLASGDFSNGPALKREFISAEVADFVAVNPYAHGDAQRMARSLGAQVVNGEVFDVPSLRFAPPPSEGLYGLLQKLPPGRWLTRPIKWGLAHLPQAVIRTLLMGFVTTYLSPDLSMFENGAILVDADGRLRSATDEPIPLVTARLGERGGYLVGDRDLYQRYSAAPHQVATAPGVAYAYLPDFRRARKDIYHEADTVAGLADRIGVPADALREAFDRAPAGPERAPYFALGPVRALLIQTNGGLRVSPELEVLDAEQRPIPGLYAAGNAGQGGILLSGYGHHLGWAFTSGRLAGRNAASS